MIIVLTGSPGTGKDTVCEMLESSDFEWISVNKLIKEKGLWTHKEMGAKVVDMSALGRELRKIIKDWRKKKSKQNLILEGHLMCEFKLPVDLCVVLRADPRVLRKRLAKRGYSKRKLEENIEAEVIDYCTQLSEKNFECSVYELDTTKSKPSRTASELKLIVSGKGKRFKAGWVDWSKFI